MNTLLATIYSFFPLRRLALVLAGISALALATAFTAEYGFGLQPCSLCLIQRGPYAAVVLLGLAAFLCKDARRRRVLLTLCGAAFATGGAIAAFHVGVEQHWWQGLEACSAGIDPTDTEALLKQLRSPAVRCDQVVWSVFGLSIATYNVPMSFGLSLATFLGLKFSKDA